ncbi:unnamed protein product [Heterobilharzia americana]|nr:unnamed protein product [Heterobilharzia americana]
MGDMNAKLGADNTGRELTMVREAISEVMNENGELFAEFCAFNDLAIAVRHCVQAQGYPQSDMDSISPDGHTKNQIDFISISRKWRRSLLNTRSRRGADVGSDHYLVQGTFQIKLKAFKEVNDRPQFKYNTRKLKDETTKEIFTSAIKTKWEISRNIPEETCVEEHRKSLKEMWKETCTTVLGGKKKEDKEWISIDTWKLIEQGDEDGETEDKPVQGCSTIRGTEYNV